MRRDRVGPTLCASLSTSSADSSPSSARRTSMFFTQASYIPLSCVAQFGISARVMTPSPPNSMIGGQPDTAPGRAGSSLSSAVNRKRPPGLSTQLSRRRQRFDLRRRKPRRRRQRPRCSRRPTPWPPCRRSGIARIRGVRTPSIDRLPTGSRLATNRAVRRSAHTVDRWRPSARAAPTATRFTLRERASQRPTLPA